MAFNISLLLPESMGAPGKLVPPSLKCLATRTLRNIKIIQQARSPSGNPLTSTPSAEEEQEQPTASLGTSGAAAEAPVGGKGGARDGEVVEVPGQQTEGGCYLQEGVIAAFMLA